MVRQLVEPAAPSSLPRMTYDEFLAWAIEHPHSEWVEGEVIEFMTVKARHALVVGFLYRLIAAFVEHRRLGIVIGDPYAMLIRDGNGEPRRHRQPDLLVLLAAHQDRLTEERLEGPADLVVEVVSDDSEKRDRQDKLAEYAAVGVPEYWLVEGRAGRQGTELYVQYVQNAAGSYDRALPDGEGRLHSTALPGFWLDPAWLAADPLPDVDDVLDEIVPGIHEERAARARARRTGRGDDA
jgi:Uma2 family endonuclease